MLPALQLFNNKQNLLFAITGAAVTFILCVSIFSYVAVNRMLSNIDEKHMTTILENSERGRQLAKVFVDINELSRNFLGRSEYLEAEGARLNQTFNAILEKSTNQKVNTSIAELQENLTTFVAIGKTINSLLHNHDNLHHEIDDKVQGIESLIGDAYINQALDGKDTSYIEQLLMLVVGYKESLLEIGKQFAELAPGYPTKPDDAESDLITAIDDLILRLQTITASTQDIAKIGERIVEDLIEYKSITLDYHRSLEVLGVHVNALNSTAEKLLSVMGEMDQDTSDSMQVIQSRIVQTNLILSIGIPALSIVAVVAMGLVIIRLFKSMDAEIHKRQQTEKALIESESRFRSLFENAPIPIHGFAVDGEIHYWNKACEKTYGYNKKEAVGKNVFDLIIPPSLLRDMKEKLDRSVSTGKVPEAEELLLKRKSGSRVPVISSLTVVQISGTEAEIYCLDVDMTEQKRLQSQLRQAQKMESIGTLTGGIAHDFNNFLSIIIGNIELALDHAEPWSPLEANLQEVKTASFRAAGVVKQLLNFSRKTEDQQLKPVDAIHIIREAMDLLRSSIPSTIEIRKILPQKSVTIMADPIQLDQVLMNLCTNASQAMEETGGVLTVSAQMVSETSTAVELQPGATQDNVLLITIADTGPGIEQEHIEKIFDPYFTTKAVGKGSGMGLSVVHGIVTAHGGTIRVQSQPGDGASFNILLPVIQEEPVKEEVCFKDTLPRGYERILFVDDEESIVAMTQEALSRLGYTVETRLNPADAIELFQSKPCDFDLVVTDMTMPQMTGVDLFQKLTSIRDNIPVIICTGHSALINHDKAKEMGVDAFVMKPLAINEFASTIRDVLDRCD